MHKTCKFCYYRERCASAETCEYYTPLSDDYDIDDITEKGRIEFRGEWFKYIENFNS